MTKHVSIEDTGPILEAIAANAYGDAWTTMNAADQAVIKQHMLTTFLPGLNVFLDQVNTQLAPQPCDMRQGEPYDFAWCETHDTTFALGDKCKFDGRETWEVYEEESRQQRGRAVVAEMRLEEAELAVAQAEHEREEWRALVVEAGLETYKPDGSELVVRALHEQRQKRIVAERERDAAQTLAVDLQSEKRAAVGKALRDYAEMLNPVVPRTQESCRRLALEIAEEVEGQGEPIAHDDGTGFYRLDASTTGIG